MSTNESRLLRINLLYITTIILHIEQIYLSLVDVSAFICYHIPQLNLAVLANDTRIASPAR